MSFDNLIWFDSLEPYKRIKFLYEWKQEKYEKRNVKSPEKSSYKIRIYDPVSFTFVLSKFLIYPASLKHFIKKMKKSHYWSVDGSVKRVTKINYIINGKSNS